jgi:hypothetical protein
MRFLRLLCLLALSPGIAHANVPGVRFTRAAIFDRVCGKLLNYSVDPLCSSELEQRMADYASAWKAEGTVLLRKAAAITKKPFAEKELSVSLSVCDFPSMSDPLLINMRYSLKCATDHPLEQGVTLSLFFHEILHRYLEGKIPADSPLLKKYSAEDETVRAHLHLFALQKAVYLDLKKAETLQAVIAKDKSLPNKSNARAWEIVNEIEDYRAFLEELRK